MRQPDDAFPASRSATHRRRCALCRRSSAVTGAKYGTIDVGCGQIATQYPRPPGNPVTAVRGAYSGGATSCIGFRGSEDLGEGLTAKFRFESFLRADTGKTGRLNENPTSVADVFYSSKGFFRLARAFGEVPLGANAKPDWLAALPASAMGANSRFSAHFRRLYDCGTRGRSVIDSEMVNSVRYILPSLGGFSGSVAVQAGEGRGAGNKVAANLGYLQKDLALTFGFQRSKHVQLASLNTAAVDQKLWVLGGNRNFGLMRLLFSWAEVNNGSSRCKLPKFGLTAPQAGGTLQFATGRDTNRVVATGSETKRKPTSRGYVYPLSKRTDLCEFLMNEKFPVVGTGKNQGDSHLTGSRHAF